MYVDGVGEDFGAVVALGEHRAVRADGSVGDEDVGCCKCGQGRESEGPD